MRSTQCATTDSSGDLARKACPRPPTTWIPARVFQRGKFIPAKAGTGMTDPENAETAKKVENNFPKLGNVGAPGAGTIKHISMQRNCVSWGKLEPARMEETE